MKRKTISADSVQSESAAAEKAMQRSLAACKDAIDTALVEASHLKSLRTEYKMSVSRITAVIRELRDLLRILAAASC